MKFTKEEFSSLLAALEYFVRQPECSRFTVLAAGIIVKSAELSFTAPRVLEEAEESNAIPFADRSKALEKNSLERSVLNGFSILAKHLAETKSVRECNGIEKGLELLHGSRVVGIFIDSLLEDHCQKTYHKSRQVIPSKKSLVNDQVAISRDNRGATYLLIDSLLAPFTAFFNTKFTKQAYFERYSNNLRYTQTLEKRAKRKL